MSQKTNTVPLAQADLVAARWKKTRGDELNGGTLESRRLSSHTPSFFQGRLLTSAGIARLPSGQTQSHPCFPLLPTHQHLLRTSPSLLSRVQIILPTSPWLCVASCMRVNRASMALTGGRAQTKALSWTRHGQGVNSTVIQRLDSTD